MRILVTYFSYTGNTAKLAHQIALRLGAEEEPILERNKTKGVSGLISGALGAALGTASRLASAAHDPADFDLVVIGTPVWSFGPAPAVNGYLDAHAKNCARVAWFCTLGHAGDSATFARMTRRSGKDPVACVSVTEKELGGDAMGTKLDRFTNALNAATR